MSTQHTPGPMAQFSLSIDADTGYQATTEGTCTPEQYGAAMASLHGNLTNLESELLGSLEAMVNERQPLGIDRPTYQAALKVIDKVATKLKGGTT